VGHRPRVPAADPAWWGIGRVARSRSLLSALSFPRHLLPLRVSSPPALRAKRRAAAPRRRASRTMGGPRAIGAMRIARSLGHRAGRVRGTRQNTIDLQWKMRAHYNARRCDGERKAAVPRTMASNGKNNVQSNREQSEIRTSACVPSDAGRQATASHSTPKRQASSALPRRTQFAVSHFANTTDATGPQE
jgi:hypothetical protein